jgi:hypothetical protein
VAHSVTRNRSDGPFITIERYVYHISRPPINR